MDSYIIRSLINNNCNIKHIWHQKNLDLPFDQICPICLEIHTKINSLKTGCCGNTYGKICFTKWINNDSNKQCPTCRNISPNVIMYK
jgi:hypothetical protein